MQTPPPPAKVERLPDTWSATDALGRPLPAFREVGPPKTNRTVGILYTLWHEPQKHVGGEPELGYYRSADPRVLRQHARLLVDAGVDVLVLDVTRALTYPDVVKTLCQVFLELRRQGERTPQLCFITHHQSATTVQKLYDEVYSPRLAPELWFLWQGKPLLLANPDEVPAAVRNFFTVREAGVGTKNQTWFGVGRGKWPWLDPTPQEPGRAPTGKIEEIPVAVAEGSRTNIGRSYHNGKQPPAEGLRTELGLYFAEQWDRALEVDPPFVLVVAWNEWQSPNLPPAETRGTEFNRDIEPMAAGIGDNYYYQLIANIRRYKGVRPLPAPSPPKTIRIDGNFADWHQVGPAFGDAPDDTGNNPNGRNDIRLCKVARDRTFLAFAAVCSEPITPNTGAPNWMTLFLDTDQNGATGWNGYDFRVAAGQLQRWTGRAWSPVARVPIATFGTRLELKLPRRLIGQSGRVALDFHWTDNWQVDLDIREFSRNGESAPDRRFNFRYEEPLASGVKR